MDWRYRKYLDYFTENEDEAKALLTKEFAEFPYWPQLASFMADIACEKMDAAEQRAAWHAQYGRQKERDDSLRSMSFYEAVHRLGHLIKHVDMICSSKDVVAAVIARHAAPEKTGSKKNPIDVPERGKPPAKK